MKRFLLLNEKTSQRILEILPGFVSWNLILFPYWGILVAPITVAYYVLLFDVYWFFQSAAIALTSSISHLRVQAAKKFNWKEEIKEFPDWKKVNHVVVIPTYKEPLHILERPFESIAKQDMPLNQIHVVLAFEHKEPREAREEKIQALTKKYGKRFGTFMTTVHKLVPGEVAGKASNERHAALAAKKELIAKKKMDIRYMTITSCDADHSFHSKHFSYLTYKFLDDPDRYHKFWQPAVLFYQNIWRLPAITRVLNAISSIWNLSQLTRKDRLINNQNYSTSFWLLDKVGYWDADVIPEDYHIFFKSFYKMGGHVEVEAIYLPVFADAPEGKNTWETMKSQYFQYQRWAWGVSDDPYVIKHYFQSTDISFVNKTIRLLFLIRDHFLWPVNWFVITLGISVPVLLNPEFSRTAIGHTLPGLSSLILTLALGFLVIMFIIHLRNIPPKPQEYPAWRVVLQPFEFILLPLAGFIFGALPGLDAHTRLMLGKYLQYRVTEKI